MPYGLGEARSKLRLALWQEMVSSTVAIKFTQLLQRLRLMGLQL